MKLSIVDMRAVLKERTLSMTGRKASEDAEMILAGVQDIKAILEEMESYANELIHTKEVLTNELNKD